MLAYMDVFAQDFLSLLELPGRGISAQLEKAKIERLSQGVEIYDLSMINPDIAPPRYLLDRLVEASMKAPNHRYAVSRGVRKLRQAFAEKYERTFGVNLDPETEVCVTMGTKEGFLNSLRCLSEPGQKVLLPAPTYPPHLAAVHVLGLTPCFYQVSSVESETLQSITACISGQSVKVLVLNFPNNPTGLCVSANFFQEVLRLCDQHGVFVINDFVYGEMGHGDFRPPSLLASAADVGSAVGAVEIYSLSKAYGVPGWRVGAVMGNPVVVQALAKLKSHIDYGIFLPVQMAAAAALSSVDNLVQGTVSEYERRAKTLIAGLTRQGWDVTPPSAGASVWARMPAGIPWQDSGSFMMDVFCKTGVLGLPGECFGTQFTSHARFSLVVSTSVIHQVLNMLESCTARPAPQALTAAL